MTKAFLANTVREKILKTAVKLLGECGIKKLAQPQIAKKAGVPQGHMTYYFPTRSDLLMAVAERSLSSIANVVLKKAGKKELDTNETLSLVIPLIQDKSRTRMMVGLLVESDENSKLRTKLQEQFALARSLVGIALGQDAESDEVALVQAAIIGLGVQQYLLDAEVPEEKLNSILKKLAEKHGEAK